MAPTIKLSIFDQIFSVCLTSYHLAVSVFCHWSLCCVTIVWIITIVKDIS